ncbi:two-component system, sensor histidine kinase YesM [Eubacterium ruminantium]|nr:two-component system, sensor histidine kinase YesM [Eubacterium ruminantium]
MIKWMRNLKLRQRMVFVYATGCFLPLIIVCIIMFNSSRRSLMDIQIKEEMRKLDEQKALVEATMDLAVELSDKIYFDDKNKKIGLLIAGNNQDLLVDYRGYKTLSDYLNNYYDGISSVCIYVNEGVLDRVDNRFFRLITDTIKEKQWYINTVEKSGLPNWSYLTNVATGKRSLRLTRVLYTRDKDMTGIISISIDPSITSNFIANSEGMVCMVLNDIDVVHSNYDLDGELLNRITDFSEESREGDVFKIKKEKYYLSSVRITPRYSEDFYDIFVMRSYEEIDDATKSAARKTILPIVGAVLLMLFAIFFLNSWFTKRINALGKAMHKVTEKDYDIWDTGIGDAKDEIWDLYNDMNRMVTDMQQLSEAAANEKLQKEQLYSRQKDVEFKMLATQINPHFLYNTLENIRMLAMINKEKEIEDISVRLTRLLRSSLEVGSDLKTLEWELDKVDCYIKIQDYRFGDRIKAEMEYDKEMAKKYLVMPFVLQPFVENAYVHGMEEMEEGGHITIKAAIDKDIHLIVEDNGRGMSEEELSAILQNMNDFENLDRTHIGVVNVNQRIKLKCGNDYGVNITSEPEKGTKVEIHLPLVEK